jgi:hypothetical protein
MFYSVGKFESNNKDWRNNVARMLKVNTNLHKSCRQRIIQCEDFRHGL